MDKKWNIELDDIKDPKINKIEKKWKDASSVMNLRTANFELFTKISHNQSLYESGKGKKDIFSEGSTQAIKRKIRAQTIQRVPDGEITTQFDKNSVEQVITEFLFKHKVLTSEYDDKSMLKNLWRAFNNSYDYGFACVRTGFEKDLDADVRVSWTLINHNDVKPAPDCQFIEEANWYIVREWLPRSELHDLIDHETGALKDPTYEENTVKYLLENDLKDGIEPKSASLQDKEKGSIPQNNIEVRTFYKRGADEFITYVPKINAKLRTVKNYDPRKDVPLHFLILEPDPEFPLGCSTVMWTLAQQQFADAFQTVAYRQLLLSANPPLMVFGNNAYPKIRMMPNSIWPMSNNQNNSVEKFPVETTTITQYGSILENVSANMMKNLNVTDATVASDANVANYSGTPQGVEQQKADKTITINQYQKQVETFFANWANHALKSYINAMNGVHKITVNEETRRRVWDIEMATMPPELRMLDTPMDSIVDGDQLEVDFSKLSSDLLAFEVRSGSLIENERDKEREAVQELILPLTQMLSGVSDNNKPVFEQTIMKLVTRLCELSNIDISATIGADFNEQLMQEMMQATMEQVLQQQGQLDQQGAAIQQMQQQLGGQPMPAEQPMEQPMPGQEMPLPPDQMPMPEANPEAMQQIPPMVNSTEMPAEGPVAGEEEPMM